MVTCEDNSRTPYTPQEPKIMILRRPQAKPDLSPNGMISIKQKQPVKTLEQVFSILVEHFIGRSIRVIQGDVMRIEN